MKKTVCCLLSFLLLLSLSACFRDTPPKRVVANYRDNKETFWKAVEICQIYDILHPINNSMLPPKQSYNFSEDTLKKMEQITKEERKTFQKCINLGCRTLYYDNDKGYAKFGIPRNDVTYQGLFFFLTEEAVPEDFESFLRNQMPYEKDIVYEKIEDTVYYYFASGGKPTESDPGTTIDHIPEDWE